MIVGSRKTGEYASIMTWKVMPPPSGGERGKRKFPGRFAPGRGYVLLFVFGCKFAQGTSRITVGTERPVWNPQEYRRGEHS